MEICKGCPFFSENKKKTGWTTARIDEHCTSCGCTLSAKARCLSCICPKEKWGAVVTHEENEDINKQLSDGEPKNKKSTN